MRFTEKTLKFYFYSASIIASLTAELIFSQAALANWKGSGISGKPYPEIVKSIQNLAAGFSDWATSVNYGKSVSGQDLVLIKIKSPNPISIGRRPAVLITEAMHGNEYMNIADQLADWFLKNREESLGLRRFLSQGGVIYLVPIVNPDGYTRQTRHNANGADLNRDFLIADGEKEEHRFRQVESRSLANWINQDIGENNLRLALNVDYHCCDGSLLYPASASDGNHDHPFTPALLQAHQTIADLMKEFIDPSYRYGPTNQVLGYYAKGTSKDYWFYRHGALSFTYEGKRKKETEKFLNHTAWWDQIFHQLSQNEFFLSLLGLVAKEAEIEESSVNAIAE
jgi:hypothetical protein